MWHENRLPKWVNSFKRRLLGLDVSESSHTSSGLMSDALKHHYYSRSPEIHEIIKRMYFENPEDFIYRSGSYAKLNINTDYLLSQITSELDFRLRQLIRFFRPIPSLYAFVESADRWEKIRTAVDGFDNTGLIPWVSLMETVEDVQRAVEGYLRERTNADDGMFVGYDIKAEQVLEGRVVDTSDPDDSKGFISPLLYKGAGSNPLNALILNDPNRNPEGESLNALLFARLAGYVIICEEQRRKPVRPYPKNVPLSSPLWGEWQFYDPYRFMEEHIDHAPGRSKLAEVERTIRDWCRQWEGATMPASMEKLLELPYTQFIAGCRDLLIEMSSSREELNYPYVRLLQFFVNPRIVRSVKSSGGGGGGQHQTRNPGRHYWKALQEVPEIEESIYGHEIEVNDILTDLSDQELDAFEEVGEDPCEEDQDRPRYKVIFGENVRAAKLELDQHVRYQRRLLASINQQLYWDGGGCTLAEMEEFVGFVKRKQDLKINGALTRKAALLLEMVVVLGVDLDMALSVEHGSEQNTSWLKGASRFVIGHAMDDLEPKTPKTHRPKLRICTAEFDEQTAYIWDYPIPVRSLAKHANIKSSKNYAHHSSRIAFRDQSGLIHELMRHLPRAKKTGKGSNPTSELGISGITPLFFESERLDIKRQCYALLKEFNGEVNAIEISRDASGLFQKEGMRTVTFRKIRQFSRSILIRSGMEMIFVDALDWQAPKDHKSAIFYYTRDAHQLAQIAKKDVWMGLQYTLSDRTGIFSKARSKKRKLPPTNYLIFGAAGLLKFEHVATCIKALQVKLNHRPLVVSDRIQMAEFIRWMNLYGLYMAIWYCCETSHRPHHIPYGDLAQIDSIFGFINMKDKTNKEGDKNRVGRVSPTLHAEMRKYADILGVVQDWALKNGLAWPNSPLVYIEEEEVHSARGVLKKKKAIKCAPFNGSKLATMIRFEFQAEANFYRKFISFLLRKDHSGKSSANLRSSPATDLENSTQALGQPTSILDAISQTDVQIWLGHSNHGTASFHQFGTTSILEHAKRMEGKLAEVIDSLGFSPLRVRPLRIKYSLVKAYPGRKW